MLKRIFLYRHGERSDLAPPSRRIPHDIIHDPPLTTTGHLQAEAAANFLQSQLSSNNRIRLVSSPMIRCIQTLEKLAYKLKLPIHLQEGFGESFQEDFGSPLSSIYIRINKQAFPILAEIYEEEHVLRPENVETLEQVPIRMRNVMEKYLPKIEEDVLVICTHLYPIWGMIKAIGDDFDSQNCDFTQVAEFEYDGERCRLVRQGVSGFLENVPKED